MLFSSLASSYHKFDFMSTNKNWLWAMTDLRHDMLDNESRYVKINQKCNNFPYITDMVIIKAEVFVMYR